MTVVILNVNARGFDKDTKVANRLAVKRLRDAADEIAAGRIPTDPGVDFVRRDPGGGGGPCAAEYVDNPMNVSASGLPEAQSRDDDD